MYEIRPYELPSLLNKQTAVLAGCAFSNATSRRRARACLDFIYTDTSFRGI